MHPPSVQRQKAGVFLRKGIILSSFAYVVVPPCAGVLNERGDHIEDKKSRLVRRGASFPGTGDFGDVLARFAQRALFALGGLLLWGFFRQTLPSLRFGETVPKRAEKLSAGAGNDGEEQGRSLALFDRDHGTWLCFAPSFFCGKVDLGRRLAVPRALLFFWGQNAEIKRGKVAIFEKA